MRVGLAAVASILILGGVSGTVRAADPAGLPLSIDAHGGIVLTVQIDEAAPVRFLLDTGASRTLVADDLARDLRAPVVARSEVAAPGGSELHLVVRLATLAVDGERVNDLLAVTIPGSRLAALAPGVKGVLGQDFLSRFNYTLDYRRQRLLWDAPRTCSEPGSLPLAQVEGIYLLALTDADGRTLRFVPDSGADTPVLFTAAAPNVETAVLTGLASDATPVEETRLKSLRVGEVTLRDLAAYRVSRPGAVGDGLLPLHHFRSISFAAGGACAIVRP